MAFVRLQLTAMWAISARLDFDDIFGWINKEQEQLLADDCSGVQAIKRTDLATFLTDETVKGRIPRTNSC